MQKEQEPLSAENGYYRLKTDAVDRLLNAENAPEVADEEIEKYITKHKRKIPSWLKVIFIKFWFAGAVCYFVMWGLGLMISGLDLMAALAIVLGLANDLLINHALRHFEPFSGAYNKWIMFPMKKFWTIFLNILYAVVLLFFIVQTYTVVNTLIAGSPETAESVPIGVEPILFGLLFMGYDMLFLAIRNTVKKVFGEAEKKAGGSTGASRKFK
ncbi:MAG: hypothetical protein K2N36_03275 [Ruminiclostridium sp.]|nr:hypothetical protein [Ruminiclostridium sp.]